MGNEAPPQAVQPVYQIDPRKDKSIALILEIVPGLFGLFGIGWLYIGQVMPGLILLIGGIVWILIAIGVGVLTGFMACFCTVPLTLIGPIASGLILHNYTKQRPQLYK